MAKRLTFAYPGDLQTATGGYIYDRQVIERLQTLLGWEVTTAPLDERFPNVDQQICDWTAHQLAKTPDQHMLVIDGLALGAMGSSAQIISVRRPFIALVHHPLALESGLTTDDADWLMQSERQALRHAQGLVVTSPDTRQTLIEHYGVSDKPIAVVMPGVEKVAMPAPRAEQPAATRKTIHLLAVGTITPRKGYDILIAALGQLKGLSWHLRIVGDTQRSTITTKTLHQQIKALGLNDRVELMGTLAPKSLAHHYDESDAFVLTSRYEGYGMAYAEALCHGLPIVATGGGAVRTTLAGSGAKFVELNDRPSLILALRDVITNPQTRLTMRQSAVAFAKHLPTWDDTARQFAEAITAIHTASASHGPN